MNFNAKRRLLNPSQIAQAIRHANLDFTIIQSLEMNNKSFKGGEKPGFKMTLMCYVRKMSSVAAGGAKLKNTVFSIEANNWQP